MLRRCMLGVSLWLCVVGFFPAVTAAEDISSVATTPIARFETPILVDDVRPHVEFLASPEMKGRTNGEALKAAEYIRDHFKQHGLKPLFNDGFFQEIPGGGEPDGNGKMPIMGRNVGAVLPGRDPRVRDEVVIISAHYDHLGVRGGRVFAGADDNASGVAMLLEVARRMAKAEKKPRRSIVFIGFDLEERMLYGSRWFVAHPPWKLERVKLFVTADMIGRSLGNLPLPTVFVMGSEHAPQLKLALDRVGEPQGVEVARLGIDLIGAIPRSDYGPFRSRKIPFLFFSTGEHPDYHTPRDVPARVDYKKVAGVSGLVLKLCTRIADADQTPAWTDDLKPNIDEARAMNRITTLLLEAEGERKFTDLQRLVISQTQTHTKQIIERGRMTADERKSLIRVSQFLLLSIF